MPNFSSLKELEKYLQNAINKSLDKEVAKAVKEQIQIAVDEVVYQSGTPVKYERRGGNIYGGMGNPIGTGSLSDINEMNHIVNNGQLIVTDDAKRNENYKFAGIGYDTNKSLTENIVEGYGNKSYWYNKPRDFIEKAKENLRQDKYHVEALKEGLERQGFDVR